MAIVQNVWFFFQDQILGMKWLNALIGNLLTALGLDISSRIGGAVQFFLYDTIKIFVLLSVLIFVISYIQSYFPPERTKRFLAASTASEQTPLLHCSVPSLHFVPAPPSRSLSDLPVQDFRWVLPFPS